MGWSNPGLYGYRRSRSGFGRPNAESHKASRATVVALLTEYEKLARENDPRTCDLIRRQPFGASRDGRIEWARHYLGENRLSSFNELLGTQAAYLLDLLAGKKTKLDAAIDLEWQRLGVRQPEAYFEAMIQKSGKFKFGQRALGQLNRWQKWKLLSELRTRVPANA
ncbi:MAG: hypothetical protein KIS92_00995 [Planctomycetota bacterium]|nr:hypothetical protein [Planctomycetota bacterium]